MAIHELADASVGRMAAILVAAVLASSLAVGCDGSLTATTDPGYSPGQPTDPGTNPGENNVAAGEVELTKPHLRRLTPAQFENTIRYALGEVYEAEDLPQFGDDIPIIGLNNDPSSLRVNDVNVASIYDSAQAIAQASIDGTPVVRDCVAAADDACWGQVVDEVGHKLWRRPLTDVERTDLLDTRAQVAAAPGTRAEQAEFLVMAMIASPNTLYRRELGSLSGEELQLTDFEIASALSYTLWNAPPDEELYQAAVNGELRDTTNLRAHAQRMADDPRAAEALAEFFIDYLKIEAIFSKTKIEELGLTPEVRQAFVDGIRRDLIATFSMPDASLLDPFRLNSFHVNDTGAAFFGVPVVGSEFEVVGMNPQERLGVLSHPGFLSVHSGEGDSGIVKRGVFTLEQLLCVELGAPPADISETEDVPEGFDDATATSREVLTVRHSSQAQCAGCHRSIDPAGFGFENYDGAGRYRTVEKGSVQIDASGELTAHGETLSYDDSVGYIDALVSSEALQSCLTDQYFTYVLGDEPRLVEREMLYQAFAANGGSVDALVEAIITTPSFTARQPQEQ